ncbi:hypothetical protein SESBI_02117 [Sesbania bispinosa]|nr:hypothetical protein SESBI_02117 [Sesbania bispinosa]
MLTCIARPKKLGDDSLSHPDDSDSNNNSAAKNHHGIKSLTYQIKDMALKASGAYKHCSPCAPPPSRLGRTRTWGKEMEARLKGISSGEGTPPTPSSSSSSAVGSGRRLVVLEEEDEPKEWVAQVEPGVLITFVSLPRGGNDLKRIRFRYVPTSFCLSFCVVLLLSVPF